MKQRIVATTPLISLVLFLFSGFVLENWILGLTAFLLIPLSTILLSGNILKRLNQFMPLITVIIFLWLALGLDYAHPGWIIFFLIPLSDMIFNGRLHPRKVVTIAVTALFLVIGFVFEAWHPGWLIFFLIPIINNIFLPNKSFAFFMNKENFKSRVREFVSDHDIEEDDEEDIIL